MNEHRLWHRPTCRWLLLGRKKPAALAARRRDERRSRLSWHAITLLLACRRPDIHPL